MTQKSTESGEDTGSSILVTGSTGNLGRQVIDQLLDEGIDSSSIVALARDPDQASDLEERGIDVRRGDYSEPDTLDAAIVGIDKLLLISSSEVGERRVEHHRNVIEAATGVGIGFIAYTSGLNADDSPMSIMDDHRATEAMIRESGIPYTVLRNGWYMENYTEQLDQALDRGAFVGCADDGRISAATRGDYAEAAATVLVEDGNDGEVYELGGDEAFTMAELAAEVTRQSDSEVVYQDLSEAEYVNMLVDQGVPEPQAAMLAETDRAIADGTLYTDSDDLHRLIGHQTTRLADAVADALS